MTQTIPRSCWWCGKRLMAVSHAEIVDPDGRIVWAHKVCEKDVRAVFRRITAQPKDDVTGAAAA